MGENSGQYFGQESQRFALTTALGSRGASVWREMWAVGNEEGEDMAETGRGKGNFGLQMY